MPMSLIDCFVPYNHISPVPSVLQQFDACPLVNTVFLLTDTHLTVEGNAEVLILDSLVSSAAMSIIAANASADYVMMVVKPVMPVLGQFALDRMLRVARDTGAVMVYSDYYKDVNGVLQAHPVIDCQKGSLRDDFDFGSVVLVHTASLKKVVQLMTQDFTYAGWYDVRLALSEQGELVRLNELLYTEPTTDWRKSGEKQFDYVNPRNREVQIEMEQACTTHLKRIGAFLDPVVDSVEFDGLGFTVEASVIIPVRNRVKTIRDAIVSVMNQQTSFEFNLIIVDNFSTDGTTELIQELAAVDSRIILLVPERHDLGIGGCWNEAVFSSYCGKFAVQLDSDDVYQHANSLQLIVDAFYDQQCAMVIGSYTMTDFSMNTIPPGLIDHREWTSDNGHNNALRINGLGAPRAFFTPVLREIKLPNTSYGEDYAVGLAISRCYRIGRVYESVYLCRRWEDNTDASLDVMKLNQHNSYKDKIRTVELKARLRMNCLK